jgi:NitT/TauT family transport system ATP-binding protein
MSIAFEKVSCAFPPRREDAQSFLAVDQVSLAVAAGEFVSLVGPTGCGKSTLLHIAAGLLRATSGRVLVQGEPLGGMNCDAGYLFQSDALMPWRTSLDNVTAGLEFRGVPASSARERGGQWLARVGLAAHGHKYPHELSGGMRKRVALAQTLILDPRILLMDEPFSALDVQTRHLMENELLGLWAQDRKTVLFVTHDLEEAISLSDRVVVLSAGPGCRPVGEFAIDLPRPRDVTEVAMNPRFVELHRQIWQTLKSEVQAAYARQLGSGG